MRVIAHRGASARAPENTLAAFALAREEGADGVELDVRRTADGTLAVCHDEHLPDGRALRDLDAAQLDGAVPELAQVLAACEPFAVVNIEIKNWPDDGDFDPGESLAEAVVALLDARGELADPRILVSAFHLPTIDRIRALAPSVRTAWLLGLIEDPAPLVARAADRGHVAVHPHHLFVDERFVEVAGAAGVEVNAWTCNEPERIRELAALGVDAVITDTPREALAALGRGR